MNTKRFLSLAVLIGAMLFASNASASGVPVGLQGLDGVPPTVFDMVDGMVNVGTESNPINLVIDPSGPTWQKTFVYEFPPETTFIPGETRIPVWEHFVIHPTPVDLIDPSHPRLPWTDWHEVIHETPNDPLQGNWEWGAQSELVIHGPDGLEVHAPGMVGGVSDLGEELNNEIWFKWPDIWIYPNEDGPLDVWVHKDIIYNGPTLTPSSTATIGEIHVWEWPTVPEPSSLALAGLGLVGLTVVARRRKNR